MFRPLPDLGSPVPLLLFTPLAQFFTVLFPPLTELTDWKNRGVLQAACILSRAEPLTKPLVETPLERPGRLHATWWWNQASCVSHECAVGFHKMRYPCTQTHRRFHGLNGSLGTIRETLRTAFFFLSKSYQYLEEQFLHKIRSEKPCIWADSQLSE